MFNLNALYERLASFVTERTSYKLRLFDSDSADAEGANQEEAAQTSTDMELPYIQLHILSLDDPAILFITGKQQLKLQHPTIPASLLRDLPLECTATANEDWLTDDTDQEGIETFFGALEAGLTERLRLLAMIDSLMIPEGIDVSFSPTESNTLLLLLNHLSHLARKFTAKIDWHASSVTWHSCGNDEAGDRGDAPVPVLEEVNAIASKYRSVTDCLQSQLQLLFENGSDQSRDRVMQ